MRTTWGGERTESEPIVSSPSNTPRCCRYSFRTAAGGVGQAGQFDLRANAGSSRRASAQAQEQFGPFDDRWLVAIRSSRAVEASPRFVPRSLRGPHSIALEAGATTHQVTSALCHASLATNRHNAKRESVEGNAVADVLHGSIGPSLGQIRARLPTDERRVLLSLFRVLRRVAGDIASVSRSACGCGETEGLRQTDLRPNCAAAWAAGVLGD